MVYLTELKTEDKAAFNPPKQLTTLDPDELAEPAPNYFIILLAL